jgi:hypothetical protein
LLASCAATFQEGDMTEAWSERFVEPVTAPTTFESPVISSQLRPIIINQSMPNDSAFAGGDYQLVALQIRYAINERLAFIATKDGFIDFNPANSPDDEGLADVAAGVKYAFIDDPEAGLLVTGGLTLELPWGDKDVFQGNGDGLLRPFVSFGQDLGRWNVLGSAAISLPMDSAEEVQSYDLHLHADFEVSPTFRPLVELNMISYTDNAEATAFDFEGGDLINLGAMDVSGNTLTTAAIGARWRLSQRIWLGVAHEVSVGREDLIDDRQTVDLIISF